MPANYGAAQSDGFILEEATLCLGEVGNALDLTIEENSVGLFKNAQIQNTKSFTDLSQGVTNGVVASVETENMTKVTGEGYEFTPKQFMFAMGQEGYNYVHTTPVVTQTTAAALTGATTLSVTSATGLAADDWIIVRPLKGVDNGLAYRIVSIATNTLTLDRPLVEAIPTQAMVYKSTIIRSHGSQDDTCSKGRYFSAKLISARQNCEPIIVIMQKVRITSGLQLNFGRADWANMPYELTAMDMVRTDNGYNEWLAGGSNQWDILTV